MIVLQEMKFGLVDPKQVLVKWMAQLKIEVRVQLKSVMVGPIPIVKVQQLCC